MVTCSFVADVQEMGFPCVEGFRNGGRTTARKYPEASLELVQLTRPSLQFAGISRWREKDKSMQQGRPVERLVRRAVCWIDPLPGRISPGISNR